jgi:hypothetical protein
VNDLIKALNGGNEKEAAEIARALARDKQPVQFALNMINESGNTVARPKPEPVIEPIKYLFHFQNHNCTKQMFE